MGASPSGEDMRSRIQSFASQENPGDFVQQTQKEATSRAAGNLGLRLAGDRFTAIEPGISMAEESESLRYSPKKLSKAPGSQYLAQSSDQTRFTGV